MERIDGAHGSVQCDHLYAEEWVVRILAQYRAVQSWIVLLTKSDAILVPPQAPLEGKLVIGAKS